VVRLESEVHARVLRLVAGSGFNTPQSRQSPTVTVVRLKSEVHALVLQLVAGSEFNTPRAVKMTVISVAMRKKKQRLEVVSGVHCCSQ
jgi:hypothetical protein